MQNSAQPKSVNLPELGIYYALYPFKRNQDVVRIQGIRSSLVISLTDGFHHQNKIPGDEAGRTAANFIAENFPKYFSKLKNIDNYQDRANEASQLTDAGLIRIFPEYVSGVGVFIVGQENVNIVVAVGSVFVYLFDDHQWYKPQEIGDYHLDVNKYPSDCSRFFGHGDLKKLDPNLYQAKADVIKLPVSQPIVIATDGTEELLSVNDLNQINKKNNVNNPEKFFEEIKKIIISRKSRQNDDASILLKI